MKVIINLSLADYVRTGNRNTDLLLEGHHPLMPLVTAYYEFFATSLWADGQPVQQVPMFLSSNAFMIWTSGVRIAMSGHEAAVYPLFRTSLESACYALLIARKPELGMVWSNRHDGEDERKASRRAFSSAVVDAAKYLEDWHSGLGAIINSLYETSIDHGAHPNTRGVMNHVQSTSQDPEELRFDQGSIYPGDSIQVFRALTASIEYGRGIAFVLSQCLPIFSQRIGGAIQALETRRAEFFSLNGHDR